MSIKILQDASFGILRTNPKITGNVKVVVDSSNNTFIESIDANDELAKSKYKAVKTSASSSYQFDVARVFSNVPSDLFYDVKKPSSDYSVLDNYGAQFDLDYCYGSFSVNSDSYKEEFGIFAPIWLENNIPDYFIIFRVDGPVTVNNKDAATENANAATVDNPANIKDLFLSKAKIIKTFDLTNSTNIGRYLRNYKTSEGFPVSSINFTTRSDQGTYFNGISIDKPGGFTSKSENVYDTLFVTDRTILENDFFITNGFERNRLTSANIINLEFLFDDPDASSFEINRYFGLFVNEEREGTFRLDGNKFYLRSQGDKQTKPKTDTQFAANNENTYTIANANGVKLYVDTEFTTTSYDIPVGSNLTANSFIPSFSDASTLDSIFYVKDKNGNFYNLNYDNSWLSDEVRLQNTSIDLLDFTGFEETILTTYGKVPDKASKASSYIEVLTEIPDGDSYVIALPKKQSYEIEVITADGGDTLTLTDEAGTFSLPISVVSSNPEDVLDQIEYEIEVSGLPIFERYSATVKNGVLLLAEKQLSCIDDNFDIIITGTSDIIITKTVSSDFFPNTIVADSTVTTPGEANGLSFCPTGTTSEIAKAMATAISNMEDTLYEATSIDNKVIIIAKVAGPRFNSLVVGRNTFMSANQVQLITTSPAFTHPDYFLYYFLGGTDNPRSKSIVDIDLFTTFSVPNRYLRTNNDKNITETITKIKSVFYYTDEEIRDRNGKLIGFKDFDKYCVVAINDKFDVFRDSMGSIYLYELYDIPFGRFSIFPMRSMDFDFLSTEYGDEKELNTEIDYYSQFPDPNSTAPTFPVTQEDVFDFYNRTSFTTLLNTLTSEVISFQKGQQAISSPNIESEYERLKENDLIETSVPSRTVPYINKWVYRNGKNVRETDYRLTVSEAFGITNFSPASDEKNRNVNYFTHEWYYLQKLPRYYGLFPAERLDKVFSYFPDPIDVTSTGLLDCNSDYFTEYFTVDYLKYPIIDGTATGVTAIATGDLIQPFTVFDEVPVPVVKQLRYSTFEGASSQNFASTLFRGIKVLVKERVENQIVIDYDISSIKTKYSTRYNDYKFSCVLIPHDGQYGGVPRKTIEYEFLENRKFKSITFLIYLKIDDLLCTTEYFENNQYSTVRNDYLDRTILYALKSKVTSLDSSIPTAYDDIILSGAIDGVRTSNPASATGSYLMANANASFLRGIQNVAGQETLFIEEVLNNKDGGYNKISVEPAGSGAQLFQVKNVLNNSIVNVVDLLSEYPSFTDGWSFLTDFAKETGTYTYLEGGYNFWTNRLNKVSFAAIQDLVNQGDPSIKYTTIMEDCSIIQNMFIIELQSANYVMKSNYLRPFETIDRSNTTTEIDVLVGNKLEFSRTDSKISPIYRHIGYYQPKFNDTLYFLDPYTVELDLAIDSKEYLIKTRMKDKNTQFMFINDFGVIPNFYLHKVNDVNPSSITQLSLKSSFLPVYPKSGQISIDYKDFYTFKTNWDASYFQKFFEKNTKTNIAGTRSVIEKRSFFGSKIMKIEDSITAETFDAIRANSEEELNTLGRDILKPDNPYEIVYYEDSRRFILDVYLEKRIIQLISELGVYDFFNKYINPIYGFGSEEDIVDDVNGYIQSNIVPRYKLGNLSLYVLKSGNVKLNQQFPIINSTLTDAQKIINGYKIDSNVQYVPLNGINNFNVRLIYNKTAGFNYSIAPSFRLNKK
jgi:hypothetical protein